MDEKGSAADAGSREGDIIIEYGGEMTSDIDELHKILTGKAVGRQAEIGI